jgi:D-glycero-alpha-D-manno-heptose 1-phosphate guanylyltransferase
MSVPYSAIILAGGLGTRLKHLLPDIPKPMAPVCGKPFLEYVLQYLQKQGCTEATLSVGYLHDSIQSYFGNSFENMHLNYVIEDTPLGTGGGIKKCLRYFSSKEDILIVNGDTYFPVDVAKMYLQHKTTRASLTIALKEMSHFERYGSVQLDTQQRILQFHEKSFCEHGFINGGIYLCNTSLIDVLPQEEKFSFETDYLNQNTASKNLYGYIDDSYFIDIGIPEDYKRAQTELQYI